MLDHTGFDVKDHAAFVKKLPAEGIKLDEPLRKAPTGSTITYNTGPLRHPHRNPPTSAPGTEVK